MIASFRCLQGLLPPNGQHIIHLSGVTDKIGVTYGTNHAIFHILTPSESVKAESDG